MPEFTPEGLAEKLDQLYALPDNELLMEARDICHDLREWLNFHFELTDEQVEYLESIPPTVNFAWGAQMAAVVISRGPIQINGHDHDGPKRTKQVRGEMVGYVSYQPEHGSDFQLQASITYTQP